jgi:hypothetical protein
MEFGLGASIGSTMFELDRVSGQKDFQPFLISARELPIRSQSPSRAQVFGQPALYLFFLVPLQK